MIDVLFIVFQFLFLCLFIFLCLAFVTGAPFVPSTPSTTQKMIELAKLQPGEKIYDLGSGDGRLLFAAAARGVVATGYEINLFLVWYSTIRSWFTPYRKKAKTKWSNFWTAEIKDADAVFVYLLPWRMKALQEKLMRDLKPGTRVISNSFIFPDWKILSEDKDLHVYAFRVPATKVHKTA